MSVKLDFSLARPYVKTICFTIALPVVFAAINRSLMTGISFAMCFTAMISRSMFSITEKNDMERLYGILPVRKSELVIGRYVFIIILGILALIFSLITHPVILSSLGENVSAFDIAAAAVFGIFLFALYTVFLIPGYYKYGSIKGKVFMYIPVAIFLVTLFLIAKIPDDDSGWLITVLSSPMLLIILAAVFVVIMYVISILVSVKIVQGKES